MKIVLRAATDEQGKSNGQISFASSDDKYMIRITVNEDKKEMFLASTCVDKKELLKAIEILAKED